jgi:hypothetical protein
LIVTGKVGGSSATAAIATAANAKAQATGNQRNVQVIEVS